LKVTLYSSRECGLCGEAHGLLRQFQRKIRFEIEVVDIESDPALYDRYRDRVPVVAVDGKEVAEAPIDGRRLQAALSA
jgi:glutaredoxin